MNIEEAIEHAKNKKGLKLCIEGLISKSSDLLEKSSLKKDINYGAGYAVSLRKFSKHFYKAREAFLNNDLEIVAEFFGLYT